jgi:hypothetical protein
MVAKILDALNEYFDAQIFQSVSIATKIQELKCSVCQAGKSRKDS